MRSLRWQVRKITKKRCISTIYFSLNSSNKSREIILRKRLTKFRLSDSIYLLTKNVLKLKDNKSLEQRFSEQEGDATVSDSPLSA